MATGNNLLTALANIANTLQTPHMPNEFRMNIFLKDILGDPVEPLIIADPVDISETEFGTAPALIETGLQIIDDNSVIL